MGYWASTIASTMIDNIHLEEHQPLPAIPFPLICLVNKFAEQMEKDMIHIFAYAHNSSHVAAK